MNTWACTIAFCTRKETPNWNFIPSELFLPKDLTSRPSLSTNRQEITIEGTSSQPSNDLSDMTDNRNTGADIHSRSQEEGACIQNCRMGNFKGVKNWFLTSCYSLVVRMGFS